MNRREFLEATGASAALLTIPSLASPTGAAKGAGTIDAQAVYDDNVLLRCYHFDRRATSDVRYIRG